MAFLRSNFIADSDPHLGGDRIIMRPPIMSDYAHWAELRAVSRTHLTPWEPAWTHDELSRGAFRRRLRIHQRDQRDDMGYAFFVFDAVTHDLIGGATLSNVRRGVTQATALGYWIGAPIARRGLMTEAVSILLPFAFDTLGLHRVEAACLPTNVASIKVLTRNGFQKEGLARRYLKINGEWQDHILFSRLDDDPDVPAEVRSD